MSDIVERLRTICDVLRTSRYNSVWEEDVREAAADIDNLLSERDGWLQEIEWLRAELAAQERRLLSTFQEVNNMALEEIERLRAAHQEIRDLENNKIVSGEGLFMRALLIARRALEPKP